MNILIVSEGGKKGKSLKIRRTRAILIGVAVLVLLPASIGAAVYWLSAALDRAVNPFVDPQYRAAMERVIERQRVQLHETREYVSHHLDALGKRLGGLQARASRIDAVEQRLADAAGLDLNEFEYSQDPPVGGPTPAAGVRANRRDLLQSVAELERHLEASEWQLDALGVLLRRDQQIPSGWPVVGGWISSGYGMRTNPISGRRQFHGGVDIPGRAGADVLAVADGVVTRSEKAGAYGWLVEVNHGHGYVTRYGHNQRNFVAVGDLVKKGEVLAQLGNSGRTTGPHVHFEVLKHGHPVNPYSYIRGRRRAS